MPSWLWFVIVVAVGLLLLAGAMLLDRREARLRTGTGEPAPRRDHAVVDSHVPHYVTQDEVDAMPSPSSLYARDLPKAGEGFGFGHAHRDFATNPDGASWEHPRLLIVDGEVTAMRELLAPLQHATPETPLVIVAAELHPEVIATLAANRRALNLPVVAAAASSQDRRRLAELTGATTLTPADLQAGYVPAQVLGMAHHWSSTSAKSWVQP
ncbi:MAG: hypothetical protein Q4G35_01030 [Propionibacteriaceae bacterium]|nr:hypothetical protein [Propionibacteriaceae bacterium]